jgi:hypothetical protein
VGAEVEAWGFEDRDGPGGRGSAEHEMSVSRLWGVGRGEFGAVSFGNGI